MQSIEARQKRIALDRVEKAWQGEARRRLGNEKRCRALEEKRLAEAMV